MELKGNLDSHNLQEIFTTLARNKQIGTLIVSDGESSKYIYFARAGVRLLSSGSRKNIRLGDLLVKRHKITPDQLQAVLARQEETGEMMGKILMDWGLVTEAEIDAAVGSQIEEEIFDLFTWENATFKFSEGAPPKELFDPNQRATRLTFDVNTLVQKAANYVDEIQRAKNLLPPPDTVFQLGEFTELEFYERDDEDPVKRIVKAIDGFRTVEEIVEVSGLNQLQAAEILGTLVRDKKIEKVDAPLPETAPGKELSAFVAQCEKELEKDPENLALRERLAQAYFDLGEIDKTVDHLSYVADEAFKAGRLEEGLATARRISEIVPGNLDNQERILRIHFDLRDTEGVLASAAVLAELYRNVGDNERVKNMYKLVLELVPEDIEIRKKLINLHLDSQDRDAAADEYEQIARIMERRGNTAGLYEIYQKISRLAPHRKDLLKKLRSSADKPMVKIPRARFHFFRKIFKIAVVLAVLGAIGAGVWWEMKQRREAAPRLREAEGLLTEGQFDEALAVLKNLEKSHPYSSLPYLVIPKKVEAVKKARREEQERKEREVSERIAKDRTRWKNLEAKETRVRRHLGRLLVSKLEDLQKEIRAFANCGRDNEFVDQAKAWLENREKHLQKAAGLLEEAKALENDGRLKDGRRLRNRLLDEFEDTSYALEMKMPYQILSEPSRAEVFDMEGNKIGETPLILYEDIYSPSGLKAFTLRKDGYFDAKIEILPSEIATDITFEVDLKRKPLWILETDEPISAAPLVQSPMVYAGSRDGHLYAVDTRRVDPLKEVTWQAAWRFKHPGRVGLGGIIYTPTAFKDMVIFPHKDSYLYAVRNGAEVWSYGFGIGNSIIGSPLVAENRVAVAVGKGRKGFLCCFPAEPVADQKPFWIFPPGGYDIPRPNAPPLLHEKDRMILGSFRDGLLLAVHLYTGSELGRINLPRDVAAPMALWEDTLFVVTEDWIARAIDVSKVSKGGSPTQRWTFPIGEPVKAGLLASGGWLIVCTTKGMILALDVRDPKKPEVEWTDRTSAPIEATPVISLNTLYIGSYDKHLYALNFYNGERTWNFALPGRINGLAVHEGIVYAVTQKGSLIAVNSG